MKGLIYLRFDYARSCICAALRDLAPFLQFKKREKHPWRNVALLKLLEPATLLKVTFLQVTFHKASHIRSC